MAFINSDAIAASSASSFHIASPPTMGNQLASSFVIPTESTTYYIYKDTAACNAIEMILIALGDVCLPVEIVKN